MDFEKESKIIEMFIGCAKTYFQLSTGVLVLTVSFHKTILGDSSIPVTNLLITVWIFLLVSILSSTLYQYAAAKHLEVRFKIGSYIQKSLPKLIVERPGIMYGIMQMSFYIGGILFMIFAYLQLN